MHLLDCYSLNCGLKIREPFIQEKFFPLDVENYITFESSGIFPSRKYDYWADVLKILIPILNEKGISVIHIGNTEESGYEKVYDLRGQASDNQIAYLINHSLLHLGVDGFANHLASFFDKKIVSLFGESPPQNNAPVFSDVRERRLMTPKTKDGSFSYSAEEDPKTINSIKPEDIAQNVCELMGLEYNYRYETLHIGEKYNTQTVELIPQGSPIDPSSLNVDSIIMRMDLRFDEECLAAQLQLNKCSVITDRPISLNLLKHLKPNLSQFVYIIGESDSKQYVEELFRMGIQCLLMTEKKGKELSALKFKYLDLGKIHQRAQCKIPKELEGEDLNNIYYRSSKYIIYDSRVYPSTASYEESLPIDMVGSSEFQKVVDKEGFWKESDLFYFVKKV